jgi:hypothetical protein
MAGILDLLIAGSWSGDFRFDDLMPPSAAWPLTRDVAHQNHSRVPTQARANFVLIAAISSKRLAQQAIKKTTGRT